MEGGWADDIGKEGIDGVQLGDVLDCPRACPEWHFINCHSLKVIQALRMRPQLTAV